MEKLKQQLVEVEATLEAWKKPPEVTGPRIVGEGLVIDEWSNLAEAINTEDYEDAAKLKIAIAATAANDTAGRANSFLMKLLKKRDIRMQLLFGTMLVQGCSWYKGFGIRRIC